MRILYLLVSDSPIEAEPKLEDAVIRRFSSAVGDESGGLDDVEKQLNRLIELEELKGSKEGS